MSTYSKEHFEQESYDQLRSDIAIQLDLEAGLAEACDGPSRQLAAEVIPDSLDFDTGLAAIIKPKRHGTSVLLADDHLHFTDLVGAFLVERGYTLVGVASTQSAVLERARESRPDVCLIDAGALATENATALLAQIVGCAPSTKVLVLTGNAEDPGPAAAAAAGAAGYVLKSASGEDLVDAIQRAARGETGVGQAPADAHDTTADDAVEAGRRLAGLRARERECLALIVSGASTEEMAETMGVTVATVRSHVRAVLAALGVHSRLGAASFALRHGLGDTRAIETEAVKRWA